MTAKLQGAADQMPFALANAMSRTASVLRDMMTDDVWPTHVEARNKRFLTAALRVEAAWNTLKIAVFAVLASLVFAVPAAFGMARISARRANALEPLFLAPMVLPSLVYGLALLIAANLMHVSPSTGLVVLANVVVFGPLMFRATSSIALQLDQSLEDASGLLGASRWATFRRVTLPLLAPGIYAGMFLVFIQSIENVSLPMFLAPAGTTILPLEMFAMLQDTLDPRIAAISGVLIAITVLVLIAVQRLTPFLRDERR
nr:ABC transporter permease [Mesorhizobium sp. BR1-1-16]